jgi:hypothetical protein
MRVCAVCRLPNPAYIETSKEPGAAATADAPQNPAGTVDKGAPAAKTPVGLSPASARANLDALRDELKRFRERYRNNGRIIGVFGSPDSGKSFLNARLQWLVEATRGGTTGRHGLRVIRSTSANTATWAEFELQGPFGAKRKVLVVDLPGEEFLGSTGDVPKEIQQHQEVLRMADGLLLYVSADVIDDPDAFQPNVHRSGTPPQEHYLRFLARAHEFRSAGADQLSDLPVFLALSRADRVIKNAGTQVPDAWQYASRKSPPLALSLIKRFSSFCCGFVASHVGAESTRAIDFTPHNVGDKWTSLREPIEQALRGTPLEAYFRACLQARMSIDVDLDRLPTPEEMRDCGISEREFARCASLVGQGNSKEYRATLERVQHLVGVSSTPLTDDRLASFGVRSMMERLFDLMEEPADGIHRGARFEYAELRLWHSARSRLRTLREDAAGWVARHLPASGSTGDRLVRFFRLSSRRQELRARLGAMAVGVLLALWGVYRWHAVPAVEERRQDVRQTVRGIASLPPGFALDPEAVWNLDEARVDRIRRDFASRLNKFGLQDDHLVRAPNFGVAREVNEHGEDFYALLPDSRDPAAQFFAGIDCAELRRCRLPTPQADQTPTADPGNGRVMNYAAALNEYLSDARSDAIDQYLLRFEKARNLTWGNNLTRAHSPTKQLLLPHLLVKLLQAHAALRDEVRTANADVRGAFTEYGAALVAALGKYRADSAQLAQANPQRVPVDLNRELLVIGVDPEVLAAHLLATAVISTDSNAELGAEVARRLQPIGESAAAFEEQYAKQYPELLCLYHHVLRLASKPPSPAYPKACQFSPTAEDNPFNLERLLVDAQFWASGRAESKIAFEQWVPAIRQAALEAAKSEREPEVLSSLQSLVNLPTQRAAWRLMLEPGSLRLAAIWSLLAIALAWVLVSFWRLVLAAHRLVAPYTPDVQA